MRAVVSAMALAAVIVAGNIDAAQGRPGAIAAGCMQLGNLKSVFPTAKAAGYTERLRIDVLPTRPPVWPGRCGAFWTSYMGGGKKVDVAVTLYRTSDDVAAALSEPRMGAVHIRSNGARVRTEGPSPGRVGATPASSTTAVSAFRNLFIVSTSISTSLRPVPVSVQLRIHRLIEDTFARQHLRHA